MEEREGGREGERALYFLALLIHTLINFVPSQEPFDSVSKFQTTTSSEESEKLRSVF